MLRWVSPFNSFAKLAELFGKDMRAERESPSSVAIKPGLCLLKRFDVCIKAYYPAKNIITAPRNEFNLVLGMDFSVARPPTCVVQSDPLHRSPSSHFPSADWIPGYFYDSFVSDTVTAHHRFSLGSVADTL